MNPVVQQQVLEATKIIESQVDAEIERIDHLDQDDLESIRRRRLEGMKKLEEQRKTWLANGHGIYTEVPGEKEFFTECKKSAKALCHFYRDSTFRCKIIDKHLSILAPKHIETRFLKINAEKAPFLAERLRIKTLPTIAIIKDGKTTDYIVGFQDLGGRDDFPTEMLEWRLGCADIINYSGNLQDPPLGEDGKTNNILKQKKANKTIRGGIDDDDSDLDE
ncbi:thioredoxin domain-containing protein 9-like [Anneissia japonica]|uniref:thioredoxin domain-containing protein 9-like n=2 Tax=Anneissia japonica TaxID=1529436 RepID=UPI0014257F03|nr:thioredoxin domain-containing protein 9-like [Anneissia japonica]